MLETEIEKAVVLHARKNGFFVRKIAFIGNTGCPDRIFIKNNNVIFIEFKSDKGKLTLKQEITIEDMLSKGAKVYVCNNVQKAIEILNNVT